MFFFANHFEIEKRASISSEGIWDLLTPKAASLCEAPHSTRQVLAFATVKLSEMYVIGYGCFFPNHFGLKTIITILIGILDSSSHLSVTSKNQQILPNM